MRSISIANFKQFAAAFFAGGFLALGCVPAHAQAPAQAILAVSEGTSGGIDSAQVIAKYQPLADILARGIGNKVSVILVRDFAALESGMKDGRFEFVIARPSDYPARGIRDYGYQYVAHAKPDGQCWMIVPKDSPIKTLADIKGRRIVLAEPAAYMAKLCRAELRDNNILVEKENTQRIKDQQATGFYLQNGFGDVAGVASYSSIAKRWEKDGHRVIHKSAKQPYNPLIARKDIAPAKLEKIRAELDKLDETESGKILLTALGFSSFQFDPQGEQNLRTLLAWLEK
jgi:phosphonate transport system substrate-binding protein